MILIIYNYYNNYIIGVNFCKTFLLFYQRIPNSTVTYEKINNMNSS